jgi:hypothetical protein
MVGKGCPDILVAFRGTWYLAELKCAQATLTQDEIHWHEVFGQRAPVHIWRSAEEALKAIGAIE